MANSNPIKKIETDQYIDYVIPQEHASKALKISTETVLDKQGWENELTHSLVVAGDPKNPEDGDLDEEELGICEELDGKKMRLVSTATRFKTTGTNPPAGVTYTIKFFADDDELDSFSSSSNTNPQRFYTKIKFSIA